MALPTVGPKPSATKVLTLGLVSVEVAMAPLFDDAKKNRPSRTTLCKEHVCKVTRNWRCPDGKGHIVKETVMGVEYPPKSGTYVLTDSAWDDLKIPGTSDIELVSWVEAMSPVYFTGTPKVLWAVGEKRDRFALVSWLLGEKGGYMLGKTADHGVSRHYALHWEDGLDCVVAYEINAGVLRAKHVEWASSRLEWVDLTDEAKSLAGELFSRLPNEFNLEDARDLLGEQQRAYVQALATDNIKAIEEIKEGRMVAADDLEALLRASVAEAKKAKPKPGTKAVTKSTVPTRKEKEKVS